MAAGVWSGFGQIVSAIPKSLASAMLAGILFGLCLAPVRAMTEVPALAAPTILGLGAGLAFRPDLCGASCADGHDRHVVFVTKLPPGVFAQSWPQPTFTPPMVSLADLGQPRPAALHRHHGIPERPGPRPCCAPTVLRHASVPSSSEPA